jgi:tetratricopeptide (TPR) repeat protein/opacity protein-like surface antigen
MIRVQENSRAKIALSNGAHNLRLGQNTTITFLSLKKEQTSLIDLLNGIIHIFSRFPRKLKVETPFVTAAVEGTEFYVKVERDQAFLSILEGRVAATNKTGSLVLASGQSAVARAGQAPALRVLVQPRDAVQWALYYPPIINWRQTDFPEGSKTDWQGMVRRSIAFYWGGDLTRAFSALEKAPKDIRDARFYLYRAALSLTVGRVDPAREDITKALILDPSNSSAFALQSIMDVVQNKKDKALSLANKAVELDPKSSTAGVALSYAQQANFDIQGALKSLQEAVQLDPENALAWARLAELFLSVADLDKAVDSAKEAVALNPDLARTQTVLGYAYLTRIKIKEAKSAFKKAIELDSAAPLARLGLGLAIIRQGDLEAGRAEIEIASGLDPNNSLVRSYLGKAYYDEKQDKLARDQFAVAKELDPLDPTPWFYDAIAKQTTNRPVEALWDYQKAIELNDNRAVYRSKLMLDSDLAARSAAIARVYNNLGFQQRALIEGWSSLNSDPTNFSAHRFLADSFSILPRREIARVSELLQSQLLQPINITPIQPRLAESNLFLIAAQGPGSTSFNEFNPLFNRNRLAFQGSGLLAENDTYGGEGIVSGIYNRFSFSGGYSYFDTDGWYDNADQTDRIANVYAQYEFTPKTSIQAEYRYRDTETGDVTLHYWEDNRLPFLREEEKTNRIRLGLRHAFSPGSILLGNFQYSDADDDAFDLFFIDSAIFGLPPPPVEIFSDGDADTSAYSGELSYLFRSKYADVVTGAGYFLIDQNITFNDTFIWPGPPPTNLDTSTSRLNQDTDHYNFYLYSYIKPIERLMLTVGGSVDHYDADDKDDALDLDRNKFNPKFGITWYPFDSTTVRGAVFRTFKRTLITDQTLEPTHVAGFNQFFDDGDATEAWVYGVGVDQKLSQNTYAGAEFFYRDLSVPFFASSISGALEVKDAAWDEYLGRAYLYYTPHKWLALRAEYGYEKFEYTERLNPGAKEVKTHSIPLGVNFFHPSGIFAGLKATYYYQNGDFQKFETGKFKNADNTFWLVDAAIGYRLPKRYGLITAGVTNLFDNDDLNYWEVDPENSRIQPDRQAFIKVTLALP